MLRILCVVVDDEKLPIWLQERLLFLLLFLSWNCYCCLLACLLALVRHGRRSTVYFSWEHCEYKAGVPEYMKSYID